MQSSTYKTSTIFVSTGRKTRVFRSIEDVPAPLRKKLHANIAGPNSRTLIVADRRGREYIFRAMKRAASPGLPAPGRSSINSARLQARWDDLKPYWLEIWLVGMLGLASWALFHWK
jgi:hypothetical protein